MRRSAKLAPLPEPTPAVASQSVPLVQVTLMPPAASTSEPLSGLTLPNDSALDETEQLAVTVASTLSVVLVVAAKAGAGARAASSAPARTAMVLVSIFCPPICSTPAALAGGFRLRSVTKRFHSNCGKCRVHLKSGLKCGRRRRQCRGRYRKNRRFQ